MVDRRCDGFFVAGTARMWKKKGKQIYELRISGEGEANT
jgi:hypothetical protein